MLDRKVTRFCPHKGRCCQEKENVTGDLLPGPIQLDCCVWEKRGMRFSELDERWQTMNISEGSHRFRQHKQFYEINSLPLSLVGLLLCVFVLFLWLLYFNVFTINPPDAPQALLLRQCVHSWLIFFTTSNVLSSKWNVYNSKKTWLRQNVFASTRFAQQSQPKYNYGRLSQRLMVGSRVLSNWLALMNGRCMKVP